MSDLVVLKKVLETARCGGAQRNVVEKTLVKMP
jgi:hypothetical protein